MITLSKLIALAIVLVFGSIGYNFLPQLFLYFIPQFEWIQSSVIGLIVGIVVDW